MIHIQNYDDTQLFDDTRSCDDTQLCDDIRSYDDTQLCDDTHSYDEIYWSDVTHLWILKHQLIGKTELCLNIDINKYYLCNFSDKWTIFSFQLAPTSACPKSVLIFAPMNARFLYDRKSAARFDLKLSSVDWLFIRLVGSCLKMAACSSKIIKPNDRLRQRENKL